jgi:acyl-CoA thioester hydrolase
MKFLRPARYDDLLTIRTILLEMPDRRACFKAEIFNESGELLNIGEVKLAFVDMKTFKTCPPPQVLIDLLQPFFQK